jgi:hypothetical protein
VVDGHPAPPAPADPDIAAVSNMLAP